MHPYLTHLLADIAAAHRQEIPESLDPPQTLREHFEAIERWVEGREESRTFGCYCGLDPANFPPAEQLSIKDMLKISKAFREMMLTWNLDIDLPDHLPVPFAYKLLVESLNEKTQILNYGFIHFDFCTGYAPDCIFKEYCPCLKEENKKPGENISGSPSEN